MSDLYESNPAFIAQVSFRGRTCGECAWAIHRSSMTWCRRSSWNQSNHHGAVYDDTPACPAFVEKGAPE